MITGTPYHKADINGPYDVIVIGSGLGALTTAGILARLGKKILVLERHYTAGGFTHTFRRGEYEWDVGLHYVGDLGKPTDTMRLVFDFITEKELKWARMAESYDRFRFPDKEYRYVAGKKEFAEELAKDFPKEKEALTRYVSLLDRVYMAAVPYFFERVLTPGRFDSLREKLTKRFFLKYATKTTKSVLSEITGDEKLRAVLAGQMGDYGLPPEESGFGLHALVTGHFMNGAFFPVGGSSRIAETIIRVIEKPGGSVVTRAEVKDLILEKDRAIGVRLANGNEITGKSVVSGIGVANTIRHLLPLEVTARHGLRRKWLNLPPSGGHICLFMGTNTPAEELGFDASNTWIYPGYDHDASFKRYFSTRGGEIPGIFISSTSVKDPQWRLRHPGTDTIEALTFAPFDWFRKWEDTPWQNRGEAYENLKARFTEKLLDALYAHFPLTKGHIHYHELSTPLSTRHFANYREGEIYGLAHTPERFLEKWLRPHTPIRDFFLTGQDTVTAGIAGALGSGLVTALAMLNTSMQNKLMEYLQLSFPGKKAKP